MSLRSRVLIGMGLIAVVLIAAAFIVTRVTSDYLLERLDDQLLSASPPARYAGGPGGPPGGGQEEDGLSTFYLGLVTGGSLRVLAEPELWQTGSLPEISVDEALAAARARQPQPFTVGTASGSGRYRILAKPGRGPDTAFLIGLPLDEVEAAASRLLVVTTLSTTIALATLGLVSWWVIRHGVRPIKRMTATATAIAEGDLSHRVEPHAAGTEAAELGTALNVMLTRIEEAFDEREATEARLRQFVADASHELRTPVTSIRGYTELYRQGGLDDDGRLPQAMRRMEQEAVRMGHLIDDLLLLARLDQGRPLDASPIDLAVVVDDAVQDARAVDPQRPIEAVVTEQVTVLGDEHRLRQVVGNLVTNSLRHTPAGTPVHVKLDRLNGRCVLQVRDEGPGMAKDVADHAFERFYRSDPSRSRDRGGSGLGLAIVRAIVQAHGGWVSLDTAPGRGTTVRVELPFHAAMTPTPSPVPAPHPT